MDLDRLQSARSTERQRDSLQSLADSFYADVGAFVRELRTERERAAEAADDPFDAPEVRRLTDDIKTAEDTAEAIYERRVGKLVKLASLEAAGMATDDEGLTTEERELFETLVARIEDNRRRVLEDVLAGEDGEPATGATAEPAEPEPERTAPSEPASEQPRDEPADADRQSTNAQAGEAGTDAADVMGAGPTGSTEPGPEPGETRADAAADTAATDDARADGAGAETTRAPSTPDVDGLTPEETGPESEDTADGSDPANGDTGGDGRGTGGDDRDADGDSRDTNGDGRDAGSDDPDRTTVRVTQDVGEILGVDERVYELNAEDVVTLPAVNAGPLVERDAAEPIDRA